MIIIFIVILIIVFGYFYYKQKNTENFKTITCNSDKAPSKFNRGKSGAWKKTCVGKACKRMRDRCDKQKEEEKQHHLTNENSDSYNGDDSDKIDESNSTYRYISKAIIFFFIFVLLTVHLIALSVSLQCNKDSNIFYKLASGLFAFMFGILYLIVNYYMCRIKVNNDPCIICKTNIFSLS